jgi:hypothetical protein
MSEAAVFAAVFAALYAGHHLGDHVFQTHRQATGKDGRGWPAWRAMAGHLAGYHACQAATLGGLCALGVPLSPAGAAAALAFSAASHGFLDRRWPVRGLLRLLGSAPFAARASGGINGMYLADQSLHVGCLYVSALLLTVLR